MNPEMRAALAALIRQYLEQTVKAEAKGTAKAAGKGAAKALPKGTKTPPMDMGTADARFWTPGANVPATVGHQGSSTVASGGVTPGMAAGDWMTPGAAATTIGAAMLLRQMMGDSTQNVAGPVTPDQAAGVPYGPLTPQQANVPMPVSAPVPAPAAAPHPTQAIAPQTAPRMTVQPTAQMVIPQGAVNGQMPVPQVGPPDVGLSFAEQLGRPEVYGMLGQLAQAIAPGSFGSNLGGFASNRAQGILTNQALQSLLTTNPTLGLSDAAAGTLGPQAIAALGQQALQYDLGNDQNVTRAFEAESPEQRLMREYIIATSRPQADRSFRASVNVDPTGKETRPGKQYTWLFDDQGNRVKVLGGDFSVQSQSAGGSGADTAVQTRLSIADARKEALEQLRVQYREYLIADPNEPGSFILSPYAPQTAQDDFKNFFFRAVRDRQKIGLIPDNVSILGENVGTKMAAPIAEPMKQRRSFNEIR